MRYGFNEWHDGIGYDLEALQEMNQIEKMVIETNLNDLPPKIASSAAGLKSGGFSQVVNKNFVKLAGISDIVIGWLPINL